MKVLEDQITIVMRGHAPARVTGEAGGTCSSVNLGRQTFESCLLQQGTHKFNRKAE